MKRHWFVYIVVAVVFVVSVPLSIRTYLSEVYLKSGADALGARQYHNAEALFARAVKLAPHDYRPQYYLANARLAAGRFQEAVEASQKALQLNPNQIPALMIVARASLALDRPEQAKQYLEMALELAPQRADVLFYLAASESQLGEWRQAHAHFEAALENGWEGKGELFSNLGVVSSKLGEMHEARQYFKNALEEEPDNPVVNVQAGMFFYEIGQHEQSVQCLQEAIRLFSEKEMPPQADVHMVKAYYFLAKTYLEALEEPYKSSAIIVDLSRKLPQDPAVRVLTDDLFTYLTQHAFSREGVSAAWYHLGAAFNLQQRYDEAEKSLTIFLQESGESNANILRLVYLELARALFKKTDYDRAIGVIDTAKTIAPDFSPLDKLRTMILTEKMASERAEAGGRVGSP